MDSGSKSSLDLFNSALNTVKCEFCKEIFSCKMAVLRHIKLRHDQKLNRFKIRQNVKSKDRRGTGLLCSKCGKSFRDSFNLQRHFSNVHENEINCMLCDYRSLERDLNAHYKEDHGIEMDIQNHAFNCEDAFTEWKRKLECNTNSKYIKGTVRKNKDGSVVIYFRCHRDGFFRSKGNNIRNLKSIGSNKINARCPSYMRACMINNRISLKYLATHIGHTNDLDRLSLSQDEKDVIAKEILNGVPVDDILHKIRDTIGTGNVRRIHLATRKDISNIITSYGLWNNCVNDRTQKKYKNDCDGPSVKNSTSQESIIYCTNKINCLSNLGDNVEAICEIDQTRNTQDNCVSKSVAFFISGEQGMVLKREGTGQVVSKKSNDGLPLHSVVEDQSVVSFVLHDKSSICRNEDGCIQVIEDQSIDSDEFNTTLNIKKDILQNHSTTEFETYDSNIIIEVDDTVVSKNFDLDRRKSNFLDKIHKMLDLVETNEDMESVLRHAAPLNSIIKSMKSRDLVGSQTKKSIRCLKPVEAQTDYLHKEGLTIENMDVFNSLESDQPEDRIAYEVIIE